MSSNCFCCFLIRVMIWSLQFPVSEGSSVGSSLFSVIACPMKTPEIKSKLKQRAKTIINQCNLRKTKGDRASITNSLLAKAF